MIAGERDMRNWMPVLGRNSEQEARKGDKVVDEGCDVPAARDSKGASLN
jgi:hypothetical protein